MIKREEIVIKWLNVRFREIVEFQSEIIPSYIHFINKGKTFMFYDIEEKKYKFHMDRVWRILREFFELKDGEIEKILSKWVSSNFSYPFNGITHNFDLASIYVEKEYKEKIEQEKLILENKIKKRTFFEQLVHNFKQFLNIVNYTLP